MEGNRTRQVKRLRTIFWFSSSLLWVGTAIFLVLYALCNVPGSAESVSEENVEAVNVLTQEAKDLLLSISVTTIIGVVAAIIIKDKLRTAIWMACTIIAAILFQETGMYVVLALWFIDEYILFALYKKYKNAVQINKEIDLRYE